jgi:hypothetical protein
MFNPPGSKENCSHCKSSKIEYYGGTPGGFSCYYRCLNCRKYVEYNISEKHLLIVGLIISIVMVFVIALTLFIFIISPLSAIVFFFGFLILCSIAGYKYGSFYDKAIVTDNLRTDLWIIHRLSKKTGLIIIAIFITVLLAYVGIVVVNIIRQ